MALTSITQSSAFKALKPLMKGDDNALVQNKTDEQGSKVKWQLGSDKAKVTVSMKNESGQMVPVKVKYGQLDDTPVQTKYKNKDGTPFVRKGPQSEYNTVVKMNLGTVLSEAANQTALAKLKDKLDELAKDPRYKDSPLLNSKAARNQTLQEFAAAFKEKYQETFKTLVGMTVARDTLPGQDGKDPLHVGAFTVGDLRAAVDELDQNIQTKIDKFVTDKVMPQVNTDRLEGKELEMIEEMGLSEANVNKLKDGVMQGKFSTQDVMYRLGQMGLNNRGGTEGTPFAKIDETFRQGHKTPEEAESLKMQLLTGELALKDLDKALSKAVFGIQV